MPSSPTKIYMKKLKFFCNPVFVFCLISTVSTTTGAQEPPTAAGIPTIAERPAVDVPESCSFFFGGWAGTWSQNMGPIRLWVLGMKSDCSIKYSYVTTTNNDAPSNFTSGEIKAGVLAVPCGQNGTCLFERNGDRLSAKYSNPFGGRNNGLFQRIN